MAESVVPPGPQATETLPPFVNLVKSPTGVGVNSNIVDPWSIILLLEMAKQAVLEGMKPQLVKPNGGMASLAAKFRR